MFKKGFYYGLGMYIGKFTAETIIEIMKNNCDKISEINSTKRISNNKIKIPIGFAVY